MFSNRIRRMSKRRQKIATGWNFGRGRRQHFVPSDPGLDLLADVLTKPIQWGGKIVPGGVAEVLPDERG